MRFSRLAAMFAALAAVAAVTLIAAPADAARGGNSQAAKACQNGGYVNYQTTSGARFADKGACTSYAARGGTLVPVPQRSVSLSFLPIEGFPQYCALTVSGQGFAPSTTYQIELQVSGSSGIGIGVATTDATGSFSVGGSAIQRDLVVSATVDGVTSPTVPVDC